MVGKLSAREQKQRGDHLDFVQKGNRPEVVKNVAPRWKGSAEKMCV